MANKEEILCGSLFYLNIVFHVQMLILLVGQWQTCN